MRDVCCARCFYVYSARSSLCPDCGSGDVFAPRARDDAENIAVLGATPANSVGKARWRMKRKHYARLALVVIFVTPIFVLPPMGLGIYGAIAALLAVGVGLSWLVSEAWPG